MGNVAREEESNVDSDGDAAGQPDATDSEPLGLEDDEQARDPATLFITPEELFAASDWGDVLRVSNFCHDRVRLVPNLNHADRCWT